MYPPPISMEKYHFFGNQHCSMNKYIYFEYLSKSSTPHLILWKNDTSLEINIACMNKHVHLR